MPEITQKTRALELKIKEIAADGTFTGYASVFGNVDSYGDVVMPGAFLASIAAWQGKGRMPAFLWQHDSREPIGVITALREDTSGLVMDGRIAIDTTRGKDAYALMKMQAINGLSIGYSTDVAEMDSVTKVYKLIQLSLWEVSLVTFPANDLARVTTVKGAPTTIRETEKRLRDAGFSHAQAKAAASAVFETLNLRDEEADLSHLHQSMTNAIKALTY